MANSSKKDTNNFNNIDFSRINMFQGYPPVQYFPQYPIPVYNYMPHPSYVPQIPKLEETCLYELKSDIISHYKIGDDKMPSLVFTEFINHVIGDSQLMHFAITHKKINIPGIVLLKYIMEYFSGDRELETNKNFDDIVNVNMIAKLLMDPRETKPHICLSTMRIAISTVSISICPNLIAPQKDFSYDTEKIKIIDLLQCIRNSFEDESIADSIEQKRVITKNHNRCRLINSIIDYSMQHRLDPAKEEARISFDTHFDLLSKNRNLFIDRWDSIGKFTDAM